MAIVIPAILEQSFEEIEKKIKKVEKLVEWVQIDFADNTLVPNSTFLDISEFSKLNVSCKIEAHLMVHEPLKYLPELITAGFKRVYAHVEGKQVENFIVKCQETDAHVGLAIDGPTDLEKLKPYLDNIDALLVMAIEAGFSGKPFREETIARIQTIKEWEFDLPIAVDGAMNLENARKVVDAGATMICSNSYIFSASDVRIPITELRSLNSPVIASVAKQSL